MARYFFDVTHGSDAYWDNDGLELPDRKAAETEALRALADMVRDSIHSVDKIDMAIEVRAGAERLFCASLIYRRIGSIQ